MIAIELSSFPFLSFPFLSFPFLSFPFLSFPFLSFPSCYARRIDPDLHAHKILFFSRDDVMHLEISCRIGSMPISIGTSASKWSRLYQVGSLASSVREDVLAIHEIATIDLENGICLAVRMWMMVIVSGGTPIIWRVQTTTSDSILSIERPRL
ncbi:hypothetical protein F5Y16DRAFT_43192 [Xylariaceae sp. FL0255]|nr:hypothetical protein F5Y16DRAFT_43192 [Xylariaceae sp. FL0255]